MKNKRKKIIFSVAIVAILILIIVSIVIAINKRKLNKINYVANEKFPKQGEQTSTPEVKEGMVPEVYEEIEVSEETEKKLATYRNIIVLGIDSRQDIYADSRSDCIMIVSINELTNEIKLVSIYRDTYLKIYDKSLDKVTHAYMYGGSALAMKTLNQNLDLDIKEFVTLNFDAVIKIINEIGGVEINVEDSEVKYITGINSAGTYNLTGEQALEYSRIRYTTGWDYKRTERMRDVFEKTFEKVQNMNFTKTSELLNILLPEVYTNISKNSIEELLPLAKKFKIIDSIGWPYKTQGITLDKWYGVPVTLEENVKKLHKEVFSNEKYEPSEDVKAISQQIINKTGYR